MAKSAAHGSPWFTDVIDTAGEQTQIGRSSMKKKSNRQEADYSGRETIYVTRNSKSGRFQDLKTTKLGHFKDIKTTKHGRTLLRSPAKSRTVGSSWRKAFSK